MSKPSVELNSSDWQSEIVRAGAGAGKTRRLTHKVITLADQFHQKKGRWPRIAVGTYTRKATEELRERMVLKAHEMQRPDLIEYVGSRSQLKISTLHGLFGLFLRQLGHLIDIDPGFNLISDIESKNLAQKILKNLVFTQHSHLLEHFDFKRLTPICHQYYQHSLQFPDMRPAQASDFQQAYQKFCQNLAQNLNKVRQQILQDCNNNIKWVEFARNLQKVESEILKSPNEQPQVLAVLSSLGAKPRKTETVPDEVNEAFNNIRKQIKSDFSQVAMKLDMWPEYEKLYKQLQALGESFCRDFLKYKLDNALLEMSDLELLTYHQMIKEPKLVEDFSREWDYWLIDEYQDTSPLQTKILSQFIGSTPHFMVGDPQQSIYLFRGAEAGLFDQKEQEFKNKGLKQDLLSTNYRSRPEVMNFINELFPKMSNEFRAMDIHREPSGQAQAVKMALADKCLDSELGPHAYENKAIIDHILNLLESGVQLDDICILSRKKQDLNDIANMLKKYNLPLHVHSTQGFYDRREIQDALSLLKFLINPYDNYNLLCLLRSPWFKVEDQWLTQWLYQTESKAYWSVLASQSHEMIQRLNEILEQKKLLGVSSVFMQALLQQGFFDMSYRHDVTGRRESNLWKLVSQLKVKEKEPGFNYLTFIEASSTDLSEDEAVEEGDAVAVLEPQKVNLMTIHASKGLQFKHVIVPRMHKKPNLNSRKKTQQFFNFDLKENLWSLPLPLEKEGGSSSSLVDMALYSEWDQKEKQEELRVLYVALTRAEETLFLTGLNKFDKGSWAHLWPYSLEEDSFSGKNFSIPIDRGPWEPYIYENAKPSDTPLRPKFPVPNKDLLNQRVSVSHLLVEPPLTTTAQTAVTKTADIKTYLQKTADGTYLHKIFEILKYNYFEISDEQIASYFPQRVERIRQALDYVLQHQEIPFKSIIELGEVEWSFQYKRRDDVIIEGQIDLWAVVDGHLWVIDYKFGSKNHINKAFEQLKIYAEALSQLVECDTIQLCALYPLDNYYNVRELNPKDFSIR